MTRKLEDAVAADVRLRAGELGHWTMRNNSGALKDDGGRLIRFGLGNESKAVNDRVKSSDLIGITSIQITQGMVGRTVGIFNATETKPEGWHLIPSDRRGQAQLRFIEEVRKRGGMATFAASREDYDNEILRWLNA